MQRPYLGTSAEAIRRHYDFPTGFWAMCLDPMLVYSCGLWAPGDDLAGAQVRKIDFYADGIRARGARRVLDVGCGWGGAARRLIDAHRVQFVVGLTLSRTQADWIADWTDSRFEAHLESWTEHVVEAPYDAIIAIGALEHFARFDVSRAQKIAAYRQFFAFCHGALRPGGRLGLQTIAKGNARLRREHIESARYLWQEIFTETDVPWLSDLARASEKRFEIESVYNHPDHYSKTAAAWHANLAMHHERAVGMVGEDAVLRFERYLEALRGSFESGQVGLLRLLLRRT